jgi:Domain of unknown function (DUF932)
MKTGRSLAQLAQELERQRQSKCDLIVPCKRLDACTDAQGVVRLRINAPQGPLTLGLEPAPVSIPIPALDARALAAPGLRDVLSAANTTNTTNTANTAPALESFRQGSTGLLFESNEPEDAIESMDRTGPDTAAGQSERSSKGAARAQALESSYALTELARRQLAEKLGIPFSYFERMRTTQPQLLDRNLNTWLCADPERRMLRTMDGRIRAVLSDRYRRLDHADLAEQVLPLLAQLPGARFESVELTETRLYLKVVTSRVSAEVAPGDVVQAGLVISNSEVGCASLSVQPLIYRLVCANGLILPDHALRKTHVGRAMTGPQGEASFFRDDTIQADDRAFFLKVRDVVQSAVSEAMLQGVAEKLRQTRRIDLQGDPASAVEVLAQRHGLNEVERTGVLRHLILGGDLTAYGLINAVTQYSQQVADYDRATELEVLGGRMLELPAPQWLSLARPG